MKVFSPKKLREKRMVEHMRDEYIKEQKDTQWIKYPHYLVTLGDLSPLKEATEALETSESKGVFLPKKSTYVMSEEEKNKLWKSRPQTGAENWKDLKRPTEQQRRRRFIQFVNESSGIKKSTENLHSKKMGKGVQCHQLAQGGDSDYNMQSYDEITQKTLQCVENKQFIFLEFTNADGVLEQVYPLSPTLEKQVVEGHYNENFQRSKQHELIEEFKERGDFIAFNKKRLDQFLAKRIEIWKLQKMADREAKREEAARERERFKEEQAQKQAMREFDKLPRWLQKKKPVAVPQLNQVVAQQTDSPIQTEPSIIKIALENHQINVTNSYDPPIDEKAGRQSRARQSSSDSPKQHAVSEISNSKTRQSTLPTIISVDVNGRQRLNNSTYVKTNQSVNFSSASPHNNRSLSESYNAAGECEMIINKIKRKTNNILRSAEDTNQGFKSVLSHVKMRQSQILRDFERYMAPTQVQRNLSKDFRKIMRMCKSFKIK